MSVEKGRGVS